MFAYCSRYPYIVRPIKRRRGAPSPVCFVLGYKHVNGATINHFWALGPSAANGLPPLKARGVSRFPLVSLEEGFHPRNYSSLHFAKLSLYHLCSIHICNARIVPLWPSFEFLPNGNVETFFSWKKVGNASAHVLATVELAVSRNKIGNRRSINRNDFRNETKRAQFHSTVLNNWTCKGQWFLYELNFKCSCQFTEIGETRFEFCTGKKLIRQFNALWQNVYHAISILASCTKTI